MPLLPFYGYFGVAIFAGLWFVSLWFFFSALYGRINLLACGTPEMRTDQPYVRLMGVLSNVVFHNALLREPFPGILHLFIFYGFVVLAVGNIFLFGEVLFPSMFKRLVETSFFGLISLSEDIFCILVYIGLLMAAYRRYIAKPDRLERSSNDATIILVLISLIVTCALFIDVFRFAAPHEKPYYYQGWAFLSSFLSSLFSRISPWILENLYSATWWSHLLLILAFLVYIPRSKHLHLIACAFNEFFRNLEPKGRMSKVDIENSESFGVEKIEGFGWKQLLDLFACVECGRCMENCPTARSGKPLNPKFFISDLKNHFLEKGPTLLKNLKNKGGGLLSNELNENKELVGEVITDETIWACTTCGYCIEHCPFYIEHTKKILELRRYLTLMMKSYPSQVKSFFKNVQRNSNPWGIGWQERGQWSAGRNIKTFGEAEGIEWLLFVGCAGSFDARNIKVTLAVCDLLDKASVSYGILGKNEKCCGETARRMGEEGLFQVIAGTNIENFKELGVKKIITMCPHCLNTLRNEYSQFGGEFEVVHHSEFLSKLVKEGKLKPSGTSVASVVYHDSCYLGRYNSIYQAPREIISSITGITPLEMPRHLDRGFCCGAGGGRMWMEETQGEKINGIRTQEAISTGAKCVASACPYCLTMFSDGLKSANREDIGVKDIAELLNENIK